MGGLVREPRSRRRDADDLVRSDKRWWTRYVPPPIERSTYVLLASLALILVYVAWRPLPGIVWHVEAPAGRGLLWALFALGWLTVLLSTFMISHFELFGLKQAMVRRFDPQAPAVLTTRYLYRYVRHPIMLGFIVAFWAAPTMTQGHLLFAVMTTAYIFIGIALEERDMVTQFGDRYRAYRARVPALLPWRIGGREARRDDAGRADAFRAGRGWLGWCWLSRCCPCPAAAPCPWAAFSPSRPGTKPMLHEHGRRPLSCVGCGWL